MKKGKVVWITGLPGSGKSAIAAALKKRRPGIAVLQMDELRRLATPEPSYSEAEREIIYRALIYAAKTLSCLGHDAAIDATGNLRRWRELARREIAPFAEVYLRCPLDIAMQREKKRMKRRGAPAGIYDKAKEGWPVPGVAVPYEEPLDPELVIETGRTGIGEAARLIDGLLRRLAKDRRG